MKNNIKENAKNDFIEMIRKSWTWARLTEEERDKFVLELDNCEDAITGTYMQRWKALNMAYSMFLFGCGYRALGWREPEETL